MDLLQRLKERKLVQWAVAYAAGAFVVFQLLDALSEPLGLTTTIQRGILTVVVFGFFITLVLAWYHGEKGRQRVSGPELLMVAALLVVAGVALSTLGTGEKAPQPIEATAPGEAEDTRPSIAVLPLNDLSPDPQDAFFARGVHTDIANALGRISSLSVKGRSSVDQYRESRPPIREIAAALGVDFLLEGTAQIVGTVVRVTVQLIDGRRDEYVWEREWQGEYLPDDAIRIQSEIAEGVASALSVVIAPEEEAQISSVPTEDPEALRLYQVGRYLWNQRTEPEMQEAIRLFQQAIQRDSMFAEAYAGLADGFLLLGNYSWARPDEVYPEAIAATDRALELDPYLASAHATRGFVRTLLRDWPGAEEDYRRALALDPDYAYTRYWYSILLRTLGRPNEALEQAELAVELDPLAPQIQAALTNHYYATRQWDLAIAEAQKLVSAHPDFENGWMYLMDAYTGAGRYEEALEFADRSEELGYDLGLGVATILALQGNREGALDEIARMQARRGPHGITPTWTAQVYTVLGDYDEAFRLLYQARDEGSPDIRWLAWEYLFDPIRSDPRFIALMEELNLPIIVYE